MVFLHLSSCFYLTLNVTLSLAAGILKGKCKSPQALTKTPSLTKLWTDASDPVLSEASAMAPVLATKPS